MGAARGGKGRGSIPAGAGEPIPEEGRQMTVRVYPRGCGGTDSCARSRPLVPGLSPRVRGNRQPENPNSFIKGSIPAGAGEPDRGSPSGIRRAVYPRGCGGTINAPELGTQGQGLSPRVRGNRFPASRSWGFRGSIPAGAGEPLWVIHRDKTTRVYPRGCGGTPEGVYPRGCGGGLSPRVRGNPKCCARNTGRKRSIPAGAGEPFRGGCCEGFDRVWTH